MTAADDLKNLALAVGGWHKTVTMQVYDMTLANVTSKMTRERFQELQHTLKPHLLMLDDSFKVLTTVNDLPRRSYYALCAKPFKLSADGLPATAVLQLKTPDGRIMPATDKSLVLSDNSYLNHLLVLRISLSPLLISTHQ